MSTNMFMQLGGEGEIGIPGEAEDKGHENWCEIIDLGHEFQIKKPKKRKKGAPPVEASKADPKPKHEPVTITKYIDEATTGILRHCWTCEPLKEVTIECLRASGTNTPVVYLRIELKDVIITKYALAANAGDLPTEVIDLEYEQVDYTTNSIDKYTGLPKGIKTEHYERSED